MNRFLLAVVITIALLGYSPYGDATIAQESQPQGQFVSSVDGLLMMESDMYRVEVDPLTLSVSLIDTQSNLEMIISDPVMTAPEYQLVDDTIYYPEKALGVRFGFSDDSLDIAFTAENAQEVVWPQTTLDPATNLILPHHEGIYVPLNDPDWTQYLSRFEWNTIESLTMPFWGIETQSGLITVIAENPFHNSIEFQQGEAGMDFTFTHRFSETHDLDQPQMFKVYLDPITSPIQPARHFRRYLEANDAIVSLSEKLETAPQIQNLIGAPHAYVWGGEPVSRFDVLDGQWKNIATALIDLQDTDSTFASILADVDISAIEEILAAEWTPAYLRIDLAALLSHLYEQDAAAFEDHFALFLKPANERGGGISTGFIDALAEQGIEKNDACCAGVGRAGKPSQCCSVCKRTGLCVWHL